MSLPADFCLLSPVDVLDRVLEMLLDSGLVAGLGDRPPLDNCLPAGLGDRKEFLDPSLLGGLGDRKEFLDPSLPFLLVCTGTKIIALPHQLT